MKILVIGNRNKVLEVLLKFEKHTLIIYALKDSYLEAYLIENKINYFAFELSERKLILERIMNEEYDILVSNGCPFIIPVEKIEDKLLINIHPTYLPNLKGKTPLNGVFYLNQRYIGATMHYITNAIDGGNIIYQEKQEITADIDQGLVYYLSFVMEGVVFEKGWQILEKHNFNFIGVPQNSDAGEYLNRTAEMANIDFRIMTMDIILRKIKSFGIKGQGCKPVEDIYPFKKIYDAEQIVNPMLLQMFANADPGTLLLEYDEKYLIKTICGIIKITRYE